MPPSTSSIASQSGPRSYIVTMCGMIESVGEVEFTLQTCELGGFAVVIVQHLQRYRAVWLGGIVSAVDRRISAVAKDASTTYPSNRSPG